MYVPLRTIVMFYVVLFSYSILFFFLIQFTEYICPLVFS